MRRRYWCPECGTRFSTDVQPTEVPTHRCPRHVNKVKPLQPVEPEPEEGQ